MAPKAGSFKKNNKIKKILAFFKKKKKNIQITGIRKKIGSIATNLT